MKVKRCKKPPPPALPSGGDGTGREEPKSRDIENQVTYQRNGLLYLAGERQPIRRGLPSPAAIGWSPVKSRALCFRQRSDNHCPKRVVCPRTGVRGAARGGGGDSFSSQRTRGVECDGSESGSALRCAFWAASRGASFGQIPPRLTRAT